MQSSIPAAEVHCESALAGPAAGAGGCYSGISKADGASHVAAKRNFRASVGHLLPR